MGGGSGVAEVIPATGQRFTIRLPALISTHFDDLLELNTACSMR